MPTGCGTTWTEAAACQHTRTPADTDTCTGYCRVEELALPTRSIQLLDKVLSTDEAISAELREAEAAHQSCLFKAMTMTPCICRELPCLRQECNKHLKRTLEFDSTAAVRLSRGCSVLQCCMQQQL